MDRCFQLWLENFLNLPVPETLDPSPKTSKADHSHETKEPTFRQSLFSSLVHVFRSSNSQDPSDCEIKEASYIETSETSKQF